jgi:hypothetical protein
MLRFIKHNFEGMDGATFYSILSLFIFLTIFIIALVITIKTPNSKIEAVQNLPLENDNLENNNNYE